MVELGETCGVIAAQSIGEPGTQLTMRHLPRGRHGQPRGRQVAPGRQEQRLRALYQPEHRGKQGRRAGGHEPLRLAGHSDERGREKERYVVVYGAASR